MSTTILERITLGVVASAGWVGLYMIANDRMSEGIGLSFLSAFGILALMMVHASGDDRDSDQSSKHWTLK